MQAVYKAALQSRPRKTRLGKPKPPDKTTPSNVKALVKEIKNETTQGNQNVQERVK